MNLYAFLSQIIPYSDSDLELLSSFGRALLPHLRVEKEGAIQLGDDVGLEYYRLQRISVGAAVGTRTIALSVQGVEPKVKEGGEKPETQASKSKRLVYRVPNQKGIAEGQSRWFCRACMKGFVIEGDGQPEACPAGHRGGDPERTAAVGPAEETSA